ncbi:hypothetical protein AMTRI_Chr02g254950 [Amborella trichopoda]
MGGVEDDDPPLKRLKISPRDIRSISKDLPLAGPLGSVGVLMASSPTVHGDEETVGSKGVIRRVELVRIITKALYSLGYEKSGALLEEESGIPLHSSQVKLFRQQVLEGKWDESVNTLRKIGQLDENTLKSSIFLILEQKLFEFLAKGSISEALRTLRSEITPLNINRRRLHELAAFIVSPPKLELVRSINHLGSNMNPRFYLLEELQKLLPPTIMIPERRLEHLLEQALNVQRKSCVFHNDHSLSLYTDHRCGRDQIPTKTVQVNEDGVLSLKHTLAGHQKSIPVMAWRPDDRQLLTCGVEEVIRRWDVETGKCLHVYEKGALTLNTCAWFPDGKHLIGGVSDKSICMWDLDGKEIDCWKGQRVLKVSDMAVTSDGKTIISICRYSAVMLYDREGKRERLIEEDQSITSFSLSKDGKFLLMNLVNEEIHLWSINGEPKLVGRYRGHKRSRLVIRSCFGGLEQAFIASGSEDSQVYLWHRGTRELFEVLPGHSGAVNCVSWNPVNAHMFASASDDSTIRIWGVEGVGSKRKGACSSNGTIHHCNGG